MSGSRLSLLAAAVLLAPFLGGIDEAVRPSLDVVVCGDSIAVGIGPRLREVLTGRHAVRTFAAEGTTTRYWSGRIASVAATRPNLVLMILGTNDLKDAQQQHVTAFGQRARRMTDELDAAGARVFWLVPNWVAWSGRIQTALSNFSVPYLMLPPSLGSGASGAGDGVHLTADGYRLAAEHIARELRL